MKQMQLPFLQPSTEGEPEPLQLLRNGASLVLSVSGGKDSDAMSHYLMDLRQKEGWSGDVSMVHSDLGTRVEWHQTPDYVRNLAMDSNVSAK